MSYFSFLFVVWILVFLRADGPVEAGSPKTSPIEQVNPQIKYNSTFHPESGIPFSQGHAANTPQELLNRKRDAIRQAFVHTWDGYEKYAWGYDELKPVTKRGDNGWGGMGCTIVDSLDTILIMGLQEPYDRAREWVQDSLSFDKDYGASTFETTIRHLGGLISAYELSHDKLFLEKAKELADRLLPAFNTKTGIPHSTVNLKTGAAWSPSWSAGNAFLAEFGSLHLEFEALAHHLNEPSYLEKVEKINDAMLAVDTSSWEGLFPSQYHPDTGRFTNDHLTFGSRGDSFYEILLKQWIHSGKHRGNIKELYDKSMKGMINKLVKKSVNGKLTYMAEMQNSRYIEKMDHLVCFVPGMLALDGDPDHLELAKELMFTCYQFYALNPTGIAPEIAGFDPARISKDSEKDFFNQAAHYLLRPETVESLFVMWRVTKDEKYRQWGWDIFESIDAFCKTDAGYSGLRDVGNDKEVVKDDTMQSFFLAETLKYLYLLFSPDDLIPLDKFVFTTEAHPLQIYDGSEKFKQREAKRIDAARLAQEAKANEEANKVDNFDPYETKTEEEKLREKELQDADPYKDENVHGRMR
jgi:mannosyl-oligosaccharide alpha-1,2-mannosidase